MKLKLSTVVQNPNIFTSFSPKEIDNFLGKSKLNFWTKYEDFEKCDLKINLNFRAKNDMIFGLKINETFLSYFQTLYFDKQ